MTSSVTNLVIISSFHGHELSWVCFCSCTLDVVVNACAFFFVSYTKAGTRPPLNPTAQITNAETHSDYTTAAGSLSAPLPTALRFTVDEQLVASRRLSEYQAYARGSANSHNSDSKASDVRASSDGTVGGAAIGMEGLPSEKAWAEMGDDPALWRGDAVGSGDRFTREPGVRSAV